jgi:hypothetical protein
MFSLCACLPVWWVRLGSMSRGPEAVGGLDAISNQLCLVIDAAELARNAHEHEVQPTSLHISAKKGVLWVSRTIPASPHLSMPLPEALLPTSSSSFFYLCLC